MLTPRVGYLAFAVIAASTAFANQAKAGLDYQPGIGRLLDACAWHNSLPAASDDELLELFEDAGVCTGQIGLIIDMLNVAKITIQQKNGTTATFHACFPDGTSRQEVRTALLSHLDSRAEYFEVLGDPPALTVVMDALVQLFPCNAA